MAPRTAIELEEFLRTHGIEFLKAKHAAVRTVAEAEVVVPSLPGAKAKNLFLREGGGERLFLVVLPYETRADMKAIAATLGVSKLRFASPEELLRVLGVEPGAVSMLALINDVQGQTVLVLDRSIWESECVTCHSLVNTATLSLTLEGLRKFLGLTGHTPIILG
jgi:Ala-tRNA(Pro) deacylase